MTTCRYPDCLRKPAYDGQAYCNDHRLRWTAGQPVEAAVLSPWVQRALAGKLPPKVAA